LRKPQIPTLEWAEHEIRKKNKDAKGRGRKIGGKAKFDFRRETGNSSVNRDITASKEEQECSTTSFAKMIKPSKSKGPAVDVKNLLRQCSAFGKNSGDEKRHN